MVLLLNGQTFVNNPSPPRITGVYLIVFFILFTVARSGHAVTSCYMAGGNTGLSNFEIDYWASEYPMLELDYIIEILNAIEKDSQQEDD